MIKLMITHTTNGIGMPIYQDLPMGSVALGCVGMSKIPYTWPPDDLGDETIS